MTEPTKPTLKDRLPSPRDIAKLLASSLVDVQATSLTANAIDNRTNLDKDNLVVKLGAAVVGTYVAAILSPVTDMMVDKSFDFVAAKSSDFKTKRAAKKAAKENTKED